MAQSKFIQDFKSFIMKGNVVDMAVGVIIGAAFGKIITALVNDIIMPPIGYIISGINFTDLKYTLPPNPLAAPNAVPATIAYGNFIQTLIDFVIVAFCIFLMLKAITKLSNKKEGTAPAKPAEPSKEEQLLTEIRDLLKEQKSKKD